VRASTLTATPTQPGNWPDPVSPPPSDHHASASSTYSETARSNACVAKIVYTETIERANYTPYWLNALVRPIFRPLVNRADRKQLQNLARLAEERSNG